MEKGKFRTRLFSITGIRVVLSVLLIVVILILHLCGIRAVKIKTGISQGGNTVGVVKYIVSKYNEFTA